MLLTTELGHGHERVHVRQLAFEQAGVSPELRRTAVPQLTPDALAAVASLAVVSPEDVAGAHEPVLVREVDSRRGAAMAQDARAADQRHVVEDDDVERLIVEQTLERRPIDHRVSCLLCEQRAEQRMPRAQRDDPHAERIGSGLLDGSATKRGERVRVMHDRDLVASSRERLRQPLDRDAVAAEGERRIERRHEARA